MGHQRLLKVRQHREALQTMRLHRRQDQLHETAPQCAMAPERVLPPQHSPTFLVLLSCLRRWWS